MARTLYKRYRREFGIAMLAYMAVMLVWPQVREIESPLLRTALTLAPMLPLALVVRAMVRLVLDSDELEQRLHLIGLAVATAVTGLGSTAAGFLAAGGVIHLDGSALIFVFPLLCASYGAARYWAAQRYGGMDEAGAGMCMSRVARLAIAVLTLAALAILAWRRGSGLYAGLAAGLGGGLLLMALIYAAVRVLRRRVRAEARPE